MDITNVQMSKSPIRLYVEIQVFCVFSLMQRNVKSTSFPIIFHDCFAREERTPQNESASVHQASAPCLAASGPAFAPRAQSKDLRSLGVKEWAVLRQASP